MHEELCLEATDTHFRGLASSLQTKPLTRLGFTIAHWRVSNKDSRCPPTVLKLNVGGVRGNGESVNCHSSNQW